MVVKKKKEKHFEVNIIEYTWEFHFSYTVLVTRICENKIEKPRKASSDS